MGKSMSITIKVNYSYEISHIYYGNSFEKFQKLREERKLKPYRVVHYSVANQVQLIGHVTGFHSEVHAKIWKAQKRNEILNKWIFAEESGQNKWYKLDPGIYGEVAKTKKWLEKKSKQYPEYWL